MLALPSKASVYPNGRTPGKSSGRMKSSGLDAKNAAAADLSKEDGADFISPLTHPISSFFVPGSIDMDILPESSRTEDAPNTLNSHLPRARSSTVLGLCSETSISIVDSPTGTSTSSPGLTL
jgi:hypothetical protein